MSACLTYFFFTVRRDKIKDFENWFWMPEPADQNEDTNLSTAPVPAPSAAAEAVHAAAAPAEGEFRALSDEPFCSFCLKSDNAIQHCSLCSTNFAHHFCLLEFDPYFEEIDTSRRYCKQLAFAHFLCFLFLMFFWVSS